uniref:Uncharacterized protein n=1 Tax=Anguilla anguilla TaxID=7936 RepID=A0A0E9T1J9_ANGAN
MYFLASSKLAILFLRLTSDLHLTVNPLRLFWCCLLFR